MWLTDTVDDEASVVDVMLVLKASGDVNADTRLKVDVDVEGEGEVMEVAKDLVADEVAVGVIGGDIVENGLNVRVDRVESNVAADVLYWSDNVDRNIDPMVDDDVDDTAADRDKLDSVALLEVKLVKLLIQRGSVDSRLSPPAIAELTAETTVDVVEEDEVDDNDDVVSMKTPLVNPIELDKPLTI